MKFFLYISFFAALILAISGFIIKGERPATGELCIGLGICCLFFLWMPAFIYHRWKNKKVEDYMLNKENILKMRNYTDNNKL
ncbi:hypothetical protein [Patiriisocius sp. Uisw_047]|jgi:hypothetical protein|uniref:hypothetical protein n=1 Tax=Patiriisocius sp. Uisw_047 TaxID=3230969 RepID=UPI0039E8E92C